MPLWYSLHIQFLLTLLARPLRSIHLEKAEDHLPLDYQAKSSNLRPALFYKVILTVQTYYWLRRAIERFYSSQVCQRTKSLLIKTQLVTNDGFLSIFWPVVNYRIMTSLIVLTLRTWLARVIWAGGLNSPSVIRN